MDIDHLHTYLSKIELLVPGEINEGIAITSLL